MIEAARAVLKNSYSPYSKYRVASAVLDDRGRISVGTNVENASYGGTICAERAAVFSAVTHGARRIEAVVVVTENKSPWPPCGMCRQVLAEFASANTPVILKSTKGPAKRLTMKALLPYSFTRKHLK
jgi:cytidine deaminase